MSVPVSFFHPRLKVDAPGMWSEWLLDLKHIMNHPLVSIMISDQDEDFLSYMIEKKISEGDRLCG